MNKILTLKDEVENGVSTRLAAEEVREAILQGLYNGQFAPGQKLIEADLVALFGRPRSYIREALLRLAGEGVVEMIPFRGAYVRRFSPEQARNIDLTLAALMSLAARQAAERIGEGNNRERLWKAFEALGAFDPDHGVYKYAQVRELFYRTIIDLSGNEEIARICPIMQGHIIRMQGARPYTERDHKARLRRFETAVQAIAAGRCEEAGREMWDTVVELAEKRTFHDE